MKGLKIERAKPSNAIDIYALLKQASEEGAWAHDNPNEKQLEQYYFDGLILRDLPSPHHFFYLAKRGRGFLGVLHAFVLPRRWDGYIDRIFVDLLFVPEKRRKKGIGKKLIDELMKEADNMNIKRIEFLADDKTSDYYKKKIKAKPIAQYMGVSL